MNNEQKKDGGLLTFVKEDEQTTRTICSWGGDMKEFKDYIKNWYWHKLDENLRLYESCGL